MIRAAVVVGVLAACSRTLGPQPPKPASLAVCDDTWEPGACIDAGRYYESRGRVQKAAEMFDRACLRRAVAGCIAGLTYDTRKFAAPACALGYEPSCLTAARFDEDVGRARAVAETTCRQTPSRCDEAASIVMVHDQRAAADLVLHACRVPEPGACGRGVRLHFRGDLTAEIEAAACDLDHADACFRLAKRSAGETRRGLLERACRARHPEACEQLGAMLSE